jgi:hypothetical protein
MMMMMMMMMMMILTFWGILTGRVSVLISKGVASAQDTIVAVGKHVSC